MTNKWDPVEQLKHIIKTLYLAFKEIGCNRERFFLFSWVLAGEPTANLDSERALQVIEYLLDTCREIDDLIVCAGSGRGRDIHAIECVSRLPKRNGSVNCVRAVKGKVGSTTGAQIW